MSKMKAKGTVATKRRPRPTRPEAKRRFPVMTVVFVLGAWLGRALGPKRKRRKKPRS